MSVSTVTGVKKKNLLSASYFLVSLKLFKNVFNNKPDATLAI